MAKVPRTEERIPRRPSPDFNHSQSSMVSGVMDEGFFKVALDDVNQYGPHAMIMLLFAVASVTAIFLLILSLL